MIRHLFPPIKVTGESFFIYLPLTIQESVKYLYAIIVYNQTSKKRIAGSLKAKGIHAHDFAASTQDILINYWGTTQTMYYIHTDYLGSITAISDATGNLVESLSYDPRGRRRNADDWNDYNVTSTMFDRGFTGHEHLPQFGLINMNGRVYEEWQKSGLRRKNSPRNIKSNFLCS